MTSQTNLLPQHEANQYFVEQDHNINQINSLSIDSLPQNTSSNQSFTPSDQTIFLNKLESVQGQKSPWTHGQQQLLFKLHNQLGNKWSLIAENFHSKQKSDNSVKNHFYSRLRKALRKLNKIIATQYKKQLKQIKQNVIYKIIEATQLKHKKNQNQSQQENENIQNITVSMELKNRMLQYSYDQREDDSSETLNTGKQLIEDILNFTKQYRKSSKKPTSSNEQQQCVVKKSKKSSLLRQSKHLGTILIGSSECSIFQSTSSSPIPSQVTTRNKISKNLQSKHDLQKAQSINSTPTIAQSHTCFKQKTQSFFKDISLLDDYFLPPSPLMIKKQTSTYEQVQKMNDQLEEMNIFEQQYQEKCETIIMNSNDHFNDPQLDQGNFSVFE